jgi:hypothetical protein
VNGGLNYKDPKVKAALVVLQVILLFAEKLLIEQSAAEKKDIFFCICSATKCKRIYFKFGKFKI